jgi:hypothetical protein
LPIDILVLAKFKFEPGDKFDEDNLCEGDRMSNGPNPRQIHNLLISNWENLNPMQALLPPRKVILRNHVNIGS